MAKHEFGIMECAPIKGRRYDEYEPQKYNCISVDDEYIENIQLELCVFNSYSHTLDIPIRGLEYAGITLIPPASLDKFISVIEADVNLTPLKNMLCRAKEQNKYVIHYGL